MEKKSFDNDKTLKNFLSKVAGFIIPDSFTLRETLDSIASFALSCISAETQILNPAKEIENKLKSSSLGASDSSLLSIFPSLFTIFSNFDAKPLGEFVFDDRFVLNNEWLNDISLCSQFPFLTFYLAEHSEIQRQVNYFLKDIEMSVSSLPLFVHYLRIFAAYRWKSFKKN